MFLVKNICKYSTRFQSIKTFSTNSRAIFPSIEQKVNSLDKYPGKRKQ